MSAQLEDGYTRTANELLDHLMKAKLNGTQHSIIYCIIRNTYGFQRKSHAMSLSYISKATGCHKDLVKRELDKLIEWKIVKVFKEATFNDSREIGINKDVLVWVVQVETKGRQSANQSTVVQSVAEQSTNQSTPTVDQLVYQERKSFKDIKDIQEEEPRTAMDAYLFSFKKMHYTGHISKYVMDLMGRGFTDTFIREVFMEMGARGIKEDERYMRKLAEDWILRGIYTRVQAEQAKEQAKKNNTVTFQQPPKKTGIPDMNETQALLDEMTRLQEAKRKRIAERALS